jgi:hypothetical protein
MLSLLSLCKKELAAALVLSGTGRSPWTFFSFSFFWFLDFSNSTMSTKVIALCGDFIANFFRKPRTAKCPAWP